MTETTNVKKVRVKTKLYKDNERIDEKFYFICDKLELATTDNTATFTLEENGEYTIKSIYEDIVNEITFAYYDKVEIAEGNGISFGDNTNDIYFENGQINTTYGYATQPISDRWQSLYEAQPDEWEQGGFTPSRDKIYLIKTENGYVKGIFLSYTTYPKLKWDFVYILK